MRTPFRRLVVIVVVALAGLAVGRVSKSAEPGPADVAVRLAQEMAAAASRRDVTSNAKLIPQTDRVAYVSNGHPITGRQYAETLGPFYASLKSLDFKWERYEVFPIGERAAVFTGWASVKTVDQKGETEAARALFTMVFADDGSGWKRVIAQKWQSEVPAVSAVLPAAPEDRVPPASGIAVHFNGSVNVTDSTFHLECPAGTPVAVTATPEPLSDGDSFLLRPAKSLPAGADCKLKVVASQVSDPRFGQTMAMDYSYSFKVAAGS
ncbi:MAG: Ig-like domain-containing protein [Thermoanaerobaculia bacterium]